MPCRLTSVDAVVANVEDVLKAQRREVGYGA
jgi:hypothetical protein